MANSNKIVERERPPKPITKRTFRLRTWKKLDTQFDRFPIFKGCDVAAASLAKTEEFKNAENIIINNDRVLYAAKEESYFAGKTVYVQRFWKTLVLYLRVDEPEKSIYNNNCVPADRTEITLEDAVKFDMVIIESVVVSRDGYRIGCGNGLVDQDIGLLIEIGSITPDTVIATIVDDLQVVDTLPKKLFKKHDTPVDLIVTPTEVIRVAKRLPRPAGVYWALLSELRLELTPYFKFFKKHQEKSGKKIFIKEYDTDIEEYPIRLRSRCCEYRIPLHIQYRLDAEIRRQTLKIFQLRTAKHDCETENEEIRTPVRYNAEPEGEQSTPESKNKLCGLGRGGDGGAVGDGDSKSDSKQQRQRKNHPVRNFCNKVFNMFRGRHGTDPNKKSSKKCTNNGNNGDGDGDGGEGGSDKQENNEQANNAVGYGGNARL